MRCWRFVLVVVWLATPVAAFEGPPRFERLSLEEGLSQSIVESIVQDETGFMWFATEDGLNRYDGYDFAIYRSQAGNPNSLVGTELKTIHLDASGVLWVGSFEGGLNRFDPFTEQITRYVKDPADPFSLSGRSIRSIVEDGEGSLWIGTQDGGLNRFDRNTSRFEHFRHDPDRADSLSHDDVRALLVDSEGSLWVGTRGGGLDRFDRASGRFEHFRHDPAADDSLSHNDVRCLFRDRDGGIWVGTYGGGLNRLNNDRSGFERYRHEAGRRGSLTSDLVTSMTMGHTGSLWVGTDGGGVCVYDAATGNFESFRHDPTVSASLSADRVYSVFVDRSNVLWVGTYGGGLSRLDIAGKPFRHFANDPDDENSLAHNIVWSFAEDRRGHIWIGTDSGGLNRYDAEANRWRRFLHDPQNPTSLSHNTVRFVIVDRHGDVWAATNGGGLNRLDASSGRFTHFRHDPNDPHSLAHDELRSVFEDSSGNLWVATFGGGLDRYDRSTGGFIHHRHDPDDDTTINHDFLRMVYEDRDGILWVGTHGGGLDRLDPTTGRFTHYTNDPNDGTSLPNNLVFAVHDGRDGTLWVGTFGGGLASLDRQSSRFTRYQTDHEPRCTSVYTLLEDERDRLWISTTNGLFRFDPGSGVFRNFDTTDGLQSDEFNGGSAFKSPNGAMYFGGINGFNVFFPDQIRSNPVPPRVVITDFQLFNRPLAIGEQVNGRTILSRPVPFTEGIVLSHRENIFSFEFAALHFNAPDKNQYAYMMEGFNEAWVRAAAGRRFATYTNLAPGDYVFRVRGSNNDGVWNDDGAAMRIRITPPITATWWFRLAAILAIVAVVIIAVRRRTRAVRMKTALTAAHDAQMAIMPQCAPEIPDFEVSGGCWPAFEVGGDFFDYLRPEDRSHELRIAVGDVSGKGMKAAMTAVMSNGMVFSRASRPGTIEQTLTDINRSIHLKTDKRMFTALCLAAVDTTTKELSFANAGLCQPLRKSSEDIGYLESAGPRLPLGALADTKYERTTLPLDRGDVVILFSDGIPEAQNASGQLYGYSAPVEFLRHLATGTMSAEQIKLALVDHVFAFAGGSHQTDDMTVVVIKAL